MLLWPFSLLGDGALPDPIAGASGWVGAGLLGLVLAWLLMIHLPAKDKQLKDLLEGKDKQIGDLLDRKWTIIQNLTKEYKEGLREVASHCESEIIKLTAYWQTQLSSLTQAIQNLTESVDQIRFPPKG